MNPLTKFLLAVLLLAVSAVSWAGCPEGQKQTYKGCEATEEKVTEAKQEVKEVTSEKLELGGFISEEIQIGVVESDAVEMSVSVGGIDRGDDWLWRSFNVILPGGDFGTISGKIGLSIWWSRAFDQTRPRGIQMKFDPMTLPSIDYQGMRSCFRFGGKGLAREDETIRLDFWRIPRMEESHCIFKKLSEADQAAVTAFVNQIETIIEQGAEGAPDADYWKKIAFRIRVNSPFVISMPASEPYCVNEEDSTAYLNPGNCYEGDQAMTYWPYRSWYNNWKKKNFKDLDRTHCYYPVTMRLTNASPVLKNYPYCYNQKSNNVYQRPGTIRDPGDCKAGDEVISRGEWQKWKISKVTGKVWTREGSEKTATLHCGEGALVTQAEGEALVSQDVVLPQPAPTIADGFCWDEDAPAVYRTGTGYCQQPEHGPPHRATAAIKAREYLENDPLPGG